MTINRDPLDKSFADLMEYADLIHNSSLPINEKLKLEGNIAVAHINLSLTHAILDLVEALEKVKTNVV